MLLSYIHYKYKIINLDNKIYKNRNNNDKIIKEAFLMSDINNNKKINSNELRQLFKIDLHLIITSRESRNIINYVNNKYIENINPNNAIPKNELTYDVFLYSFHTTIMDNAILKMKVGANETTVTTTTDDDDDEKRDSEQQKLSLIDLTTSNSSSNNSNSRSTLLKSILKRTIFSTSFMIIIHTLMLLHAPISKKLFLFYVCVHIGDDSSSSSSKNSGKYYLKSDLNIECYNTEWSAFHPIIIFVLFTFTIGLPVMLIIILCWAKKNNKLYNRSFFSKFGFLYKGYEKNIEWWEIHEIFRKIILTGLLLFSSSKPLIRSVFATMICIIQCINLNYFKPHRNSIVFCVEQIANLSSTFKYLVAVMITSTTITTDSNIRGREDISSDDISSERETMGLILVTVDTIVLLFSFVASFGCFYLLHLTIHNQEMNEKANSEDENDRLSLSSPHSSSKSTTHWRGGGGSTLGCTYNIK